MRNKLLLSFLAVIIFALISNLLYKRFVTRDFEEYVSGTREDQLYWIMASVEGSYRAGAWDHMSLHDAVHWAVMLGFDISITSLNGSEVINSATVLNMLSPSMKKRMQSIADLSSASGEFEPYPLYQEGQQIGTMLIRQLQRPVVDEKEALFRQRGRQFLIISFLIAGGGALLLSFFFSIFLSRPLNRMKKAAESMAKGDFSCRVPVYSKDEVGRLSESFNFMAEALQREDALRRHLTSNIAHELRTPLAVMKANIEAMHDGVITDHEQGLENVAAENEKLIRLVEGIEDITKAEASFFSPNEHAVLDLGEFITSVASRMAPLAAEKGLELRISSAGNFDVTTDPEKLDRIIQNLLSNAVKYTEKGTVSVDFGHNEHSFFIEISDTGIGIPEDLQKDVFRRFYRGRRSNGIGLGLAIVKELLDVMGGSIEVKSSEGNGTAFRIWLPANKG